MTQRAGSRVGAARHRRQIDLHGVGTGSETPNRVRPAAIGRVGSDDVASAVENIDHHARNAGLAGIEHAVGIEVGPDEVPDGRRTGEAEVDVGFGLVGLDRDRCDRSSRRLGVVHRRQGGGVDLDRVRTRVDAGEGVRPVRRGRGVDDIAAAVEQVDRDTVQTGLGNIEPPVTVEIVEDEVADRRRRGVAVVDRVDDIARGDRQRRGDGGRRGELATGGRTHRHRRVVDGHRVLRPASAR